jgi:hypothetical protein
VAPSCTAVHAASIVDVARAATERASTTVGFRLRGFSNRRSSGGRFQRLLVAFALLGKPNILLLG